MVDTNTSSAEKTLINLILGIKIEVLDLSSQIQGDILGEILGETVSPIFRNISMNQMEGTTSALLRLVTSFFFYEDTCHYILLNSKSLTTPEAAATHLM